MPRLPGSKEAFPGSATRTALFSQHSLGICPWVAVGRGYRISLASNPRGLSYTNVFSPLLQISSKLLVCLLPGNPCKPSPQMPLCVPAMSHRWKTLFTFSYSCGKKFQTYLFSRFLPLTTFLFHVRSSTAEIISHNLFPQFLLLASNRAFQNLSRHTAGYSRQGCRRSPPPKRSAPPPPSTRIH